MPSHPHTSFHVSEPLHVGEVRRAATTMASALGFDASDAGRLALVVTEATNNVVKHAGKGQVLLRPLRDLSESLGVELLVLDRGRGMADVSRCLEDGYSTAGSPGTGLGAISRIANLFDVYSNPEQGTALLVRVLSQPRRAQSREQPAEDVGAIRVAAPGETDCGDAWGMTWEQNRVRVMVADGLGHGTRAADAANEAVRILNAQNHLRIPELFDLMHGALQSTRGAAVSLAEIDRAAGEVQFCGVGNVAGFLAWPGGSRAMTTHNGTIGGQFARARVETYPLRSGAALIMHTDGVNSRASVEVYPGLLAREPTLIAAVLYRDFVRGNDDATVVVVRESWSRR